MTLPIFLTPPDMTLKSPLLNHFHPAVAAAAASILDERKVMAKPDIEHHTLIRFLDKLSYRAPKTTQPGHGTSIMQAPTSTSGRLDGSLGSRQALRNEAVNSSHFKNQKLGGVAVEDVFFHEYFSHSHQPARETTRNARGSPVSSDGDREIWEALESAEGDGITASDQSEANDVFMDDAATSDFSDSGDGILGDLGSDASSDLSSLGDEHQEDAFDSPVPALEVDKEPAARVRADRKSRRKALKNLPIFASADDYADMLGNDEQL